MDIDTAHRYLERERLPSTKQHVYVSLRLFLKLIRRRPEYLLNRTARERNEKQLTSNAFSTHSVPKPRAWRKEAKLQLI